MGELLSVTSNKQKKNVSSHGSPCMYVSDIHIALWYESHNVWLTYHAHCTWGPIYMACEIINVWQMM